MIGYTHHSSQQATPAGKHFAIANGQLSKQTLGSRTRYKARVVSLGTFAEVVDHIKSLTAQDFLTAGIMTARSCTAVPAAALLTLEQSGEPLFDQDGDPLRTFSKTDSPWSDGPGIMVIDADDRSITQAIDELVAAVPQARDWPVLAMTSSGSMISSASGELLRGERGCHLAVPVTSGRAIPQALEDIHRRLWLAGHGRIVLSKAGTQLNRSGVDLAMRVSSQPVFTRASLSDGLVHNKTFITRNIDAPLVDLSGLALSAAELTEYTTLVAEAKRASLPEAVRVQRQHATARAQDLVEAAQARGVVLSPAAAQAQVLRMTQQRTLGLDVVLHTARGPVTVAEVLHSPADWHDVACKDPVEPGYAPVGVAKIFTQSGRPVVHSFAHGGSTYQLVGSAPDHGFDIGQWEAKTLEVELAAIEASMGDVGLMRALEAPRTRKGTIGERTTEEVALQLALAEVGAEELPDDLQPLPAPAFGVATESGPVAVELTVDALPRVLACWSATDQTTMLEEWSSAVVRWCSLVQRDDPRLATVARACKTATAQPIAAVRETLAEARVQFIETIRLALDTARPKVDDEAMALPAADPAEVAAERERSAAQHERTLAEKSAGLREDVFRNLDRDIGRLGIVGEETAVALTFLVMLTSCLPKPTSLILRGKPGTGKSAVTEAVAKLMPPERVFLVSSMSAKALIYEPRSFEHCTIVLAEAEGLRRDMGDETNQLAEMVRVLLSEGRLVHKSVEKVDGQLITQTHAVDGPTNLVTTTTRAHLDPELETRCLDHWSDVTDNHAQAVIAGIVARKTGAGVVDAEVDLPAWHSLVDWVHAFSGEVIHPWATLLAEHYKQDGSRKYRDLKALFSLIEVVAIMRREQRQRDNKGRLMSTIADYEVVHGLIAARLGELGGVTVPEAVQETYLKLAQILEDKAPAKSTDSGIAELRKLVRTDNDFGRYLQASFRCMAPLLGISKSQVERDINRLAGLGMLYVERDNPRKPGKVYLTVDAEAINKSSAPAIPAPKLLELEGGSQ